MAASSSWFTEFPRYRFNEYSRYLRETYGQKVYRVSVDAGFTCPNRALSADGSGCIYCEVTGSRAPYLGDEQDLSAQIKNAQSFLESRYGARLYSLYFQANSNTNAKVEKLKVIYDTGLSAAGFCELIVSTRPDCVDEEKADLLSSYRSEELSVWVELGLQSSSASTLARIKRGHTLGHFENAFTMLRERKINVSVHVIFGLPGEGEEEIMHTIRYLAALRPDGIKIHNLHIPRNTYIADMYARGEVVAPGSERHLEYVIRALEALPEETIIMRLTCDTPRSSLLCPRYFRDKAAFYSSLRMKMEERNTWQARCFDSSK
jgi:radical SAM protein (TIGR01212 family)